MPSRVEHAYHELCAYTLSHGDPAFLHQHAVDAWTAQTATPGGKPIGLTMALVGLYLHVERGFSGREVQRTHMRLARRKQTWPVWQLPDERGALTALDVIASPPGLERDRAIHAWAAAVWQPYATNRAAVAELLRRNGVA